MPLKDIKQFSLALTKIPNAGPYNARRIMFSLLDNQNLNDVVSILSKIQKEFVKCHICFCWDTEDPCSICASARVEHSLCIVENSMEMWSIEETRTYNGRYFVVGNNALKLIDKYSLYVAKISNMIKRFDLEEVITAFRINPDTQIASHYIKNKLLDEFPNIRFAQIGNGVPIGNSVDYTDRNTLSIAIKNRYNI